MAAPLLVLLIILGALAIVFGRSAFISEANLAHRRSTSEAFQRVSGRIAQFVLLNRRLPCPADGRLATDHASAGLEQRSGQNCRVGILTESVPAFTQTHGVIPWKSIGLSELDASDGWGNRLTFRVTPELARDNSMNLTFCDTAGTGGAPGGQCDSGCSIASLTAGCTPPTAVTTSKGLPVRTLAPLLFLTMNPAATPSTGAAYVVISHGENVQGAYNNQGLPQSAAIAAGTLEASNNASVSFTFATSTSAQPFVDDAPSYSGGTGHFDDLMLRPTILEVVEAAKLGARTRVSGAFGAQDLAAILGYTPDPTINASTGQNTLDFGVFTVQAFGSSAREISLGQGASGTGIGSIGAGLTSNSFSTINSQSDEGLLFEFDTPGRYLGITLVDFGTQSGDSERVRFWFHVGGSWIQISRTACRAGNVLANFTLNPGGDFTQVYVEARGTASGVTSSQFLIGAIRSCPPGTPSCAAPGADPANNCPIP